MEAVLVFPHCCTITYHKEFDFTFMLAKRVEARRVAFLFWLLVDVSDEGPRA
jgi:hypothetical protein